MNNSSFTGFVQKLNDEKAIMLIPVIAFVGIMMLTGFVGNVAICYFHGCTTKTTPTSCFIVGLALFDLIICTFSMPIAIVDLRFFYTFPDVTLCKILRTTNFVCTISSGLILIAIATERYRRVCRPFRRQITVFQARFICFISFIISCALSWPSFMFYTVVTVDVSIPGSGVFQRYDCTIVKDESKHIYIHAFNATHILLFTIGIVALTLLYILVGIKLIRLKRFRKYGSVDDRLFSKPSEFLIGENSALRRSKKDKDKHNNCANNTDVNKSKIKSTGSKLPSNFLKQSTSSNKNMTNETSIVGAEDTKFSECNSASNDVGTGHIKLVQTNSPVHQGKECDDLEFSETVWNDSPNCTSGTYNIDSVTRASDIKKTRYGNSLNKKITSSTNTVRYNTLMLVITVTFIVSYLPYLCLAVWRNLSKGYELSSMTDLQLIFYSVGIRSYFLNNAMNPMIYGLFNSTFRRFFTSVFCKCCLPKSNCQ